MPTIPKDVVTYIPSDNPPEHQSKFAKYGNITRHIVHTDSQTSGTAYGDIVEASATDYVDYTSHLQKAELAVASNESANAEVPRVASEQQRNEEKLASNEELEEQVKRQEGMIRILQEQV
jgi:hypothetical protein